MVAPISLVYAAALLTGALADSNDVCSSSANVTSQDDLNKLSSCAKFSGDINFVNAAGDLVLNGIQSIDGSLIAEGASTLASLNAPTLANITKRFVLTNQTSLSTLSFPQLTQVGSIEFTTLPELQELQFNAGVSKADDVVISNTRLGSLQGLNLSEINTFNVNNNLNIQEISVAITSVANALEISYNSDKVNVSLPDLKQANNITLRFVASVDAPNLEGVNQSLGFINNTFYSLNFPKLTQVGGSLALVSNSKLSNVSFPGLESIGGGFQIANNTNLKAISGFPKVKRVGGAVDFIGNFSQASLPSLSDVEGGVTVESAQQFNCSSFDDSHSNGDFHGNDYVCKGAEASVSTALSAGGSGTGGSGSSGSATATGSGAASGSAGASGSDSSSKKKNDASTTAVSGVLGSLFVALMHLL